MPWKVTNQQPTPIAVVQPNHLRAPLPCGHPTLVAHAVRKLSFHGLVYVRVGRWPFTDGETLIAFYGGAGSLRLRAPRTGIEAVYRCDRA